MIKVINMRDYNNKCPSWAMRVDRATKWGNEYTHLSYGKGKYKVKTQKEAVEMFEKEQLPRIVKEARKELPKNTPFACWCSPGFCHALILWEAVNV